MSQHLHTPDPWALDKVQSDCLYIVAEQGKQWNNPTICAFYEDVTPEDSVTIGPWLKPFDNAEANARLILASPNLLKACEALHDALSNILEDVNSPDRHMDGVTGGEMHPWIERSQRAAALKAIRKSFRALVKAKGEP